MRKRANYRAPPRPLHLWNCSKSCAHASLAGDGARASALLPCMSRRRAGTSGWSGSDCSVAESAAFSARLALTLTSALRAILLEPAAAHEPDRRTLGGGVVQ